MPATRFNRLTPKSIIQLLEGHKAREEARYRRVAWQTAHLMNVSQKTVRGRVTADTLMGTPARLTPTPLAEAASDDEPAEDAGLAYVAMLNAAFKGTDART